MEKLLQLILQQHPDFADEIEGCTEEEISQFEKLIPNSQMPQEYKIFLQYLGRKTGRVFGIRRDRNTHQPADKEDLQIHIDINFPSVFAFYKRALKKGNTGTFTVVEDYGHDAKDFFLFGLDNWGNDNGNLFLDLRTPDLRVVEISGTVELLEHAPSFRAFLFEISFKRTLNTYEYSKQWL